MGRRTKNLAKVSPRAFAWDRALIATLRHSTLPFDAELDVVALGDSLGTRERLSLVAQFAAHQALLQFAGVADTAFNAGEWRVVRKRGSDCRLVRVAAAHPDPSTAPPVLTVIHRFADAIGAPPLDVLRQSWGRAEAVYAEAHRRLRQDVASDLRWTQTAAAGSIAAPGPDALRTLWQSRGGRHACRDIDALQAMATLDESVTLIVLGGGSPLRRYSAIEPLAALSGPLDGLSETEITERVVKHFDERRLLFVVRDLESFDGASRHVVQILSSFDEATWITPDGTPLPEAKHFVVTQRLETLRELEGHSFEWIERLVSSPEYAAVLDRGALPANDAQPIALPEPKRSYLGALALLGPRVSRDVATRFLANFLFNGALDELVVDGITSLSGETFVFHTDLAHLVPPSSRAALCRVAAEASDEPIRSAMLLLKAGDSADAAERLERVQWTSAEEMVPVLRGFPRGAMTPKLADSLAAALIDCGRYHEARSTTTNELLLARCDRRTGDYASALARVERFNTRDFEAALLHSELLFLDGRYNDAFAALKECDTNDPAQRARLSYHRALLSNEAQQSFAGRIDDPYYFARYMTYRAIRHRDVDAALTSTATSLELARTVPDRIDVFLDRVYVLFTAGRWRETRAQAMEALSVIEETDGDRAAGGILFTLAFLAADDGQWVHAAHQIERLGHFYSGVGDAQRLRELDLLTAHLDFSRGRFGRARAAAESALDAQLSADMREAANLILDEIDRIEGITTQLRSQGRTANVELTRRHRRLVGIEPDATPLERFRSALVRADQVTAERLARELGIEMELPAAATSELHVLRTAATREFPFGPHEFGALRWRHATRNRLGNWNELGSLPPMPAGELDHLLSHAATDWISCGERELLYIDGLARWQPESRDAIAAIFRTRAENVRLRRLIEQEEPQERAAAPEGLVGNSPAMLDVYATIARVAKRDVAVCVLGESGTGKELAARAIHRQSGRRQKTFTAVNCAALPENLIESELFGHVRGAFTGADRDRAGLIETTDGGTLFLDEIGEMPLTAQAKLLRFLQEGEFRRVGDVTNRTADVRIVSATNLKLDTAVEEGRFREDLYYRVRGVEVALPPLRDRGADILLLASHFVAAEREKHRIGASSFTPDVVGVFSSYAWPGNVRELQNTIRAAHALAGEGRVIDVQHLPERLRQVRISGTVAGSYQDAVSRFRRDLIEKSLAAVNGNQNRAAAMLHMSRQALAYQIRELGIMVR
jgi:DNA-binding NtrC family response regulator